jgi:glycosyltransferase involved in cell wall biosynthesis
MSAKPCLLFLIPSLVANGAERQLCELVRHLDPERFTVHVAVLYGPTRTDAGLWAELSGLPGLGLHCLHKRRGVLGYLAALPRLLALMLHLRPDIVHGYMDGNLPVLVLGRLLRTRVVWGIRRTSRDLVTMDPLSRWLLQVEVRLGRFADLVIFNSEAGRRSYVAMGLRAPRQEVVANGFDLARFRPDTQLGAGQRRAWGLAAGVPVIGLVGRLHPVKDHATFLRAAALVARRWPTAQFVCVGDGPAGLLGRLQALAGSLGIADQVLFAGACSGMAGVYNALDCLVLASTDEGFPNVLGEAMACGVPCVTTRVGDAELLVGSCGAVVGVGDEQAMAEGIARFLEEASQARADRAEASRERIRVRFSVEALARNTEQLMLSLISSTSAPRASQG